MFRDLPRRSPSEARSRRDRLRAQTAGEIKAIALRLMADGGPGAISLRAIAREMGMTAGAIYSYFATRDDLITTLIGDVYTALVEAAEAARDAVPGGDPGGRRLLVQLADALPHLAQPLEIRLARLATPTDPLAGLVLLGAQVVALVHDRAAPGVHLEHLINQRLVLTAPLQRLAHNLGVGSDQR